MQQITDAEKNASKLLRSNCTLQIIVDSSSARLTMVERIARTKRRKLPPDSIYINCDFIIGSMAVAERL